jgi:hypothetical protein
MQRGNHLAFRITNHLVAGTVVWLSLAVAGPVHAQSVTHQAVNLSFLYPLSTNRTPDVSSSFRLSLFYGRLHDIRGLDLNLGASLLSGDMRGVQLTGLYSQVGGDLKGLAVAVGPNYVMGDVEGMEFSFFPNVVTGTMSGFQYSWMINLVQEEVSGAQLSAILNQAGGGGGFLQLSAVANAAGRDFEGVQLAAGFNYTNGSLTGVQTGLANAAVEMHGLQVGMLNFTEVQHGLQVGALNVNGESGGVPVGLINYSKEGGQADWVSYASSLSLANTGVRTIVNRFYSMFTVGVDDVDEGYADTAFLSWQYGYRIPLARAFDLGFDLGYTHIMPKKSDDVDVNDNLHFAIQARVLAELRFSRRFSVFAGGGLSDIFSAYSSSATSEIKPLAVAGISVF